MYLGMGYPEPQRYLLTHYYSTFNGTVFINEKKQVNKRR